MEKQYFFSDSKLLYGMLYFPDKENSCIKPTLIVHPFGEEKKSSHRTLVNIAQVIASLGGYALIFDMRGIGDSDGELLEVRLNDWMYDINQASNFLREKSGYKTINILGIRVGAYFASLFLHKNDIVSKAIFLAPVFNINSFFRETIRSKQIKEYLTVGKVASSLKVQYELLSNGRIIDFDGYPLTGSLYDEMINNKLNIILEILSKSEKNIIIIPVSQNRRPDKKYNLFIDYENIEIRYVVAQPFWARIGEKDILPILNEIITLFTYE